MGSSSVARVRNSLILLGFLLAACLADKSYKEEEGEELSLKTGSEAEPLQESNLRSKRESKESEITKRGKGDKKKTSKRKQKKRAQRKKKTNRNSKSQKNQQRKEKRKLREKKRRLSQKKKGKGKNEKKSGKGKDDTRSERCTATVSDDCLTNALEVMVWERSAVRNFLKKYSRYSKFTEQTGNKNAKKGKFQDAADLLSEGAGGDLNNITCDTNDTSRNSRRVSEYKEQYNVLDNCSATVEEACSNFTIPEDWNELQDCYKNLTNPPHLLNSTSKIKALVQECVTLDSEDASAHCACWENINTSEEVTLFKSNKCIKKMDKTMKAMKEFKLGKKGVGGCLNAFKACKTAEKAAPGLVQDCMNFESSHDTEVKVDNSTARLFF